MTYMYEERGMKDWKLHLEAADGRQVVVVDQVDAALDYMRILTTMFRIWCHLLTQSLRQTVHVLTN